MPLDKEVLLISLYDPLLKSDSPRFGTDLASLTSWNGL